MNEFDPTADESGDVCSTMPPFVIPERVYVVPVLPRGVLDILGDRIMRDLEDSIFEDFAERFNPYGPRSLPVPTEEAYAHVLAAQEGDGD